MSAAVEARVAEVKKAISDPEVAWLFENCFPNTLDTTVQTGRRDGKPDTLVITGDINAMWLRDSTAHVWPYLPLAKEDRALMEKFGVSPFFHVFNRCLRKSLVPGSP